MELESCHPHPMLFPPSSLPTGNKPNKVCEGICPRVPCQLKLLAWGSCYECLPRSPCKMPYTPDWFHHHRTVQASSYSCSKCPKPLWLRIPRCGGTPASNHVTWSWQTAGLHEFHRPLFPLSFTECPQVALEWKSYVRKTFVLWERQHLEGCVF